MAAELPKALESDWWDKMIAPGTVGGMFAEGTKKVGDFLETPPPTPTPAPVVAPAPAPAPAAAPLAAAAPPPVTPKTVAPPMAIPMAEHTQTTTGQVLHDPTAVKRLQGAEADVQAAVLEGAKTGAAKAAEMATVREQSIAHQKELDAQAANDELVQQNRIEGAVIEQRKMLDDLSKSKKDPDRIWKERGTGARIAAAIGMALGAFGAALTGGRNGAMDIVNSAIDRDLDAQESEIQVKRDKINIQGNLIAQIRQSGVDERSARSMARQHYLEQTAATLESKAAASPADVQQNAVMTVAQLREKAEAEAEQRKQITTQTVKAKAPAYSPMDLQKMNEEERKRFVPDAGGLALDAGQAAKMNEYAAAHNKIVGKIQALQALVDKHGNETFPTTAKAEMVQLFNGITTDMNKEAGLGAMSGSDRELIQGQIADPTKFWARGVTTSKLLGALLNTFGEAKLHTYQAYGLAAK